jgi:hypothetical protein
VPPSGLVVSDALDEQVQVHLAGIGKLMGGGRNNRARAI